MLSALRSTEKKLAASSGLKLSPESDESASVVSPASEGANRPAGCLGGTLHRKLLWKLLSFSAGGEGEGVSSMLVCIGKIW